MIYVARNLDSPDRLQSERGRGCRAVMLFDAIPAEKMGAYGGDHGDFSDGMLFCCTFSGSPGELSSLLPGGEFPSLCRRLLVYSPSPFACMAPRIPFEEYGFFSYGALGALHLSQRECRSLESCMDDTASELSHSDDDYKMHITAENIIRLLDSCLRYYERQFITRELRNAALMREYRGLLSAALSGEAPGPRGLDAEYCASRLGLSRGYFEDLVKFDTGMGHDEYLEHRKIEEARKRMEAGRTDIGTLCAELGFPSAGRFGSLFRKITGMCPNEYRLNCKTELFFLPSQADLKKN